MATPFAFGGNSLARDEILAWASLAWGAACAGNGLDNCAGRGARDGVAAGTGVLPPAVNICQNGLWLRGGAGEEREVTAGSLVRVTGDEDR